MAGRGRLACLPHAASPNVFGPVRQLDRRPIAIIAESKIDNALRHNLVACGAHSTRGRKIRRASSATLRSQKRKRHGRLVRIRAIVASTLQQCSLRRPVSLRTGSSKIMFRSVVLLSYRAMSERQSLHPLVEGSRSGGHL